VRPIWKGAISFGLVTIPVGLYSATEDRRPKFNQLRDSDHSRIRYKRVAEKDGVEVPFDNIVKGYQVEKDRYVVFSAEEWADIVKGITGGIVDVVQFVDQAAIDPIHYKKSYYLAPEETGIKAYKILHDASREAVEDAARMKVKGQEIVASESPKATGVVDLMEALKASVEATKQRQAG
jgi:DNA end-binding protein Ku